jgi:hypothetical protein
MGRTPLPDRLAVDDREAARILGLGRGLLRKQRSTRDPNGVPYVRVGRRVVYRLADLERYLAARALRPDAQKKVA